MAACSACATTPSTRRRWTTHGIAPIDLVVVNLYPFEESAGRGADYAEIVENIDIGGPAMIRAAAKNHAYVAVVTDPGDYAAVLERARQNVGALSLEFRQKLAAKAFARTAAYDAAISGWFADGARRSSTRRWRAFGGKLDEAMRYGENPHQQAAFYRHRRQAAGRRHGAAAAGQGALLQQHQRHRRRLRAGRRVRSGAQRRRRHHQARQSVRRRRGRDLAEAYRKALRCDPVSAFGGIVALNRTLDARSRGRDRRRSSPR